MVRRPGQTVRTIAPSQCTSHRRPVAPSDGAFSEETRIEWQRQQILELMPAGLATQIGEDDFEVAAKLPQDLPARAARWRRRDRVGDDGHTPECAVPFGKRLEHRDAFSADREAVSRVLDVAASDDDAVGRFERRADLELRVGGLGVTPGTARGGDEFTRRTRVCW